MPKRHRVWTALAVICVVLVSAAVLVDSRPVEIECIPGQPYEQAFEGDELSAKGVGVPRSRVLLEVFVRTT